jgi:ribosome-binding factor A
LGIGYKRADRLGDVILKEISQMILREEIKDPRVHSVVLTGIKLTDDLGLARVYFTVIVDEKDRDEILRGLQSASGFIKRELSRRLRIKRAPDLQFEFDTVLEEGYRIDDLLKGVKVERS